MAWRGAGMAVQVSWRAKLKPTKVFEASGGKKNNAPLKNKWTKMRVLCVTRVRFRPFHAPLSSLYFLISTLHGLPSLPFPSRSSNFAHFSHPILRSPSHHFASSRFTSPPSLSSNLSYILHPIPRSPSTSLRFTLLPLQSIFLSLPPLSSTSL